MSDTQNTPQDSMFKPGKIGWNELTTTDPAGSIKFYTGLFGWGTEKFPMPDADYTLFTHDGQAFGGVMATPAPTRWINYVVVEDIDAALAKSTSLGGKTMMGPKDIPMVGRIAVVEDPQGGVIGLHECEKK